MGRFEWLLVVPLLPGCGGSSGTEGPEFGMTERGVPTLAFPTEMPAPGAFALQNAFPGLSFTFPLALTHAPDGTDRLFVAEIGGRILVFDNDAATTTTSVFLDLSASLFSDTENGILGLAFDPDYATSGRFYVHYSAPPTSVGPDHTSMLSSFRVSAGDPNAADPASETVLMEIDQPYFNHNGGGIAFGPDGMLYVAVGDGGRQNDPDGRAQDLTTVLGKVLRLTPDGGVPADNPFVGQGGGVRAEIWAYGFRNPWRLSFDRNTGDLWLGDVGQDALEEVDLVRRGENHGWDYFEGTLFHESPPGALPLIVPPVLDYAHGLDGRSVTGGYVYRGAATPSLFGAYVYGDFVSGRLWALVWDGTAVVSNDLLGVLSGPTSFGEDAAGELYVCSNDGRIYELVETTPGPVPAFPQRLSDTGLFTDTANLVAAPGVVEYGVNVPLWSDGARKRRWIALPGQAQIDFHATEAWQFPVATVLVKHFELETQPGVVRRLETRVLVNELGGWQGYTYRWNATQSDADLLPGGASDTFTVLDASAPGGQRQQTWEFPARTDCLVCHTFAAGRVLGVRTRQLNGQFPYALRSDNQLRAWNHVGFFGSDIGDPAFLDALPDLADPAFPIVDRARAYLAVNCAQCHRPFGTTPVNIDLRYGIPTAQTNTVLVVPNSGDLGLPSPFIVAPGNKEASTLWERLRRTDTSRMPQLGTNVVDQEGVDLIGEWIDQGAN